MKQRKLTLRIAAAVIAATAAFAVTACAPTAEPEESAEGLTTVKVGNLIFTGTAPFRMGVEKGFFEDEGLKIEETEGDSPAALGGQLTSGQLDVAFSTTTFLITAVSEGADLRAIAAVDGLIDPDNPSSGIVVKSDSDITSLADLNGKKVAIPAIGSVLALAAAADIDAQGGDSKQVEMVQIPFPQMQQALETGNVDAIVPTEPFLSVALASGARSLAGPEVDILPDASVTAWAASKRWIDSNPDTAAAFTRAMNKSIEYAADHQDEVLAMMPEYTGLDAKQLETISFGTVLTPELNKESFTQQADLLVKYGMIKKAPALEDLIYEPRN